MNSEHAALQLRMENSRKGKKSGKKDFQHLTHTWMEETVKKPWYIIRREKKREEDDEREREKEKEKKVKT